MAVSHANHHLQTCGLRNSAPTRCTSATPSSYPAVENCADHNNLRKNCSNREKAPAQTSQPALTAPSPASPRGAVPAAVCRDLQKACDEGDVEKVDKILSSGVVDPKDADLLKGKPPLYWAVVRGKLPLVKFLVEKFSCNPGFMTEHGGATLFHTACARGHLDVARYLSTLRAVETDAPRKDGSTPLMAACFYGHLPILKFLVEELHCEPQVPVSCSAEGSLLHIALSKNDKADIVRYLVSECGLDPNALRKYGETPVHVACSTGNLEVVKYLGEELGCSLEVQDETGDTPLHLSSQNNHADVVKFLIERGCKVDTVNKSGLTPLSVACRYGKREAAKLLLELGKANPNCHNDERLSPLQCTRDKDIITELIRHGANTANFASSVLYNHGKETSDEALVRMFIVGHPMAGKSTLVEALQEVKGRVQGRLFKRKKITGVSPSTAGIVPVQFESPKLGRVLLFDFAGQNEYYASHAALLEASKTSAPLFVLVVNLLENDEEIKFQINFWLSFINNHHVPGASVAHIAVIGSHKDKLRKECPLVYRKKLLAVENAVKSAVFEYPLLCMLGFFPVDCRKPHKHVKLRSKLRESCKELRKNSEVDGCCHLLSVFLADKFTGQVTCSVGRVVTEIRESDFALPCTPERLCQLVEALSERQNILFLRNRTHIDQSWIVLEVDTLFTKINGCIFAPHNFKEHKISSDSGTGVVSWSRLQGTIHELNLEPELVVAFLRKLEFCEEVSDPEILSLIRQGTTTLTKGLSCSILHFPRDEVVVPSRASTTPGRYHRAASQRSRPHIHVEEDEELSFARSPHLENQEGGSPSLPGALTGAVTNSIPNLQASCSQPMEVLHEERDDRTARKSSTPSAESLLQIPIVHQRGKSRSDPKFDNHTHKASFVVTGRRAQSCNHVVSQKDTRYFFFPGLMSHERPSDGRVWTADESFLYHTGWCMKVSHANQFFTPRLLHILLLRISFGFATAVTPCGGLGTRQCTMWKNGIRWLDRDGIETVVEMLEQDRAVVVLMRGKAGSELDCVALRSELVHIILEVRLKFCPNLRVGQYLIDPKDLANQPYPFATRCLDSITLYEVSTVAASVVDTKEWVIDTKGDTFCNVTNLLYFEPYAHLGRELLHRLCSDDSDTVRDEKLYEFLHDYSQAHFNYAYELSVILKIRRSPFSKQQRLSYSSASINSTLVASVGNGLDTYSSLSPGSSVFSQSHIPHGGWCAHNTCGGILQCEAPGARNECMELLDKWWQSSSSLTLADFRKLIHNYSVFRDIDLLEFCCCSDTDVELETQ
ncbi:Ankyrin-3 [Geodia barretti]|uniref:Ankyrin-3 n=1 Tax=Geodia barretti TaxID=519541 RepID=A0AA35XA20_GEOBA|nr:Ankyrin-3 [Geodia barretti]